MEDKQKLWDELLIEGWHKFWKVNGLQLQFYIRAKGLPNDKTVKPSWEEVSDFIMGSNLKRSYRLKNSERLPLWGRQELRAFIAAHSPKRRSCLWSGKHTDEAILEAIDRFPWSYKGHAGQKLDREQLREKEKYNRETGATRTIKVRTHSSAGNTDWSKVK